MVSPWQVQCQVNQDHSLLRDFFEKQSKFQRFKDKDYKKESSCRQTMYSVSKDTVVPELMKLSHFFSFFSDSKDQTVIEKVLLANDRGN